MPLNVLVVDDSAVARAMIIRTLKLTGLDLGETPQAANGAEGLQAVENHPVDLIITDINMPVMNGEDMILRLRANPAWSHIPLVVVSTEGSETRVGRLQEYGARFIHKPFTPEAIRQVVVELMGASR